MKTHLRRGDNGFASYVGLADHPLLSEEDFFGRNLRQQKKRTKKRETFTNGTAVRKTQNVACHRWRSAAPRDCRGGRSLNFILYVLCRDVPPYPNLPVRP